MAKAREGLEVLPTVAVHTPEYQEIRDYLKEVFGEFQNCFVPLCPIIAPPCGVKFKVKRPIASVSWGIHQIDPILPGEYTIRRMDAGMSCHRAQIDNLEEGSSRTVICGYTDGDIIDWRGCEPIEEEAEKT